MLNKSVTYSRQFASRDKMRRGRPDRGQAGFAGGSPARRLNITGKMFYSSQYRVDNQRRAPVRGRQ